MCSCKCAHSCLRSHCALPVIVMVARLCGKKNWLYWYYCFPYNGTTFVTHSLISGQVRLFILFLFLPHLVCWICYHCLHCLPSSFYAPSVVCHNLTGTSACCNICMVLYAVIHEHKSGAYTTKMMSVMKDSGLSRPNSYLSCVCVSCQWPHNKDHYNGFVCTMKFGHPSHTICCFTMKRT